MSLRHVLIPCHRWLRLHLPVQQTCVARAGGTKHCSVGCLLVAGHVVPHALLCTSISNVAAGPHCASLSSYPMC